MPGCPDTCTNSSTSVIIFKPIKLNEFLRYEIDFSLPGISLDEKIILSLGLNLI